jgi:small-conductance mechanosensitive channel
MDEFREFLNHELFEVYDTSYTVGILLLVPTAFLLGLFLIHRLERVLVTNLTSRQHDRDLILLVRRLYLVVTWILLILFVLSLLKIPLTAFAFISGAIAIGVGFGAQNIINNFISGWILMWERPIRIGDFLELGDVRGTVETIDTRSTRIRRVDGVHLLVPNSQLLENTVVNWTLVDKLARGIVRVGVSYGSPVQKVAALIKSVADEHPDIIEEPAPLVIFEDFGDSALIFDLYFWINSFGEKDLRVIRSDLRFRIAALFDENEIVIAFPQQDVHMEGQLKIITERAQQKSV